MEKGSIDSTVTPVTTPVIMTNLNQPQPQSLTDEQIEARVTNLLVDPQDLTEKEITTLTTWRDTPAVRDNLKNPVLGIFQALDWRLAQKQRQQQEREDSLARAREAKEKVVQGNLSGISLDDLSAIAADLTPEQTLQSLWITVARVAIAQREEQRMNLAEMLYMSPCNHFLLGLVPKLSREEILQLIALVELGTIGNWRGNSPQAHISFIPPENGVKKFFWVFSRTSREYKKHLRQQESDE